MNSHQQPIEYTFQPSPLIFIQGLGKDGIPQGSSKDLKRSTTPIVHNPLLINADRITRKLETIRASSGLEFVSLFQKHSLTEDCIWNDDLIKSQSNIPILKFRLRFVDNEILLPQFLNKPASQVTDENGSGSSTPQNSVKSPLSPWNEDSDLFPDGIISANWIQKYKDIIPSVFISVHELKSDFSEEKQGSDESESELIEELKYLKTQIVQRGIKFLPIIVSSRSTALNPDLIDKVSSIRKQAGLQSKNSLLFLPSGSERELKTFVNQVLTMLKPLSSDFYNTVEKKIKRKKSRQSSVQVSQIPQGLLQPFWDTRYWIKLAMIEEFKSQPETALKYWEQGYQSILEIFKSLPKEHNRWNEFRMLLDFITFHAVRNILYLENCNLAYSRFDTHLQNVITFLKTHEIKPKSYSVLTWLSAQFSWFLDLADYCPMEIVPTEEPYKLTNSSWLSMPNPGYLYLQAVSLTEKRRAQAVQFDEAEFVDPYLSLPIEEERNFDYNLACIALLKKSILFFLKSKHFERTQIYSRFQMGTYYFKMGKYSDALETFRECHDYFELQHGNKTLHSEVLKMIYECNLKLDNNARAVQVLMQLASDVKFDGLDKFELQLETETVTSTASILKAELVFKQADIPISEPCDLQLTFKYELNSLASDSLKIQSVFLEFEPESHILPILIEQDGTGDDSEDLQIVTVTKDEKYEGKANFNLKTAFQVFQFKGIYGDNIGTSSLKPTIKVNATFNEIIPIEFNLALENDKLKRHFPWYKPGKTGKGLRKDYFKISPTAPPLGVRILPRRPKANVEVKNQSIYYLGEHVDIPVVIKSDDDEKVTVTAEADLEFLSQWSSEEKLLKCELEPHSEQESSLQFTIPSNFTHKVLKFNLEVSYFAGVNTEIPIQETVAVHFEVIRPLKGRISVLPRFRPGDIPSPFAQKYDEEPPVIPVPTRYWCARANILLQSEQIELVSSLLSLSHLQDFVSVIDIESKQLNIDTTDVKSVVSDENFSTKSAEAVIRREIPLTIGVDVKWRRKGSEQVNEFSLSSLETTLPLFDPRVLLILTKEKEPKPLSTVHLKYLIENPSPRIFQFATTFTNDAGLNVTGDLNNNTFPVLPFTTQELNYQVEMKAGSQIPVLKVFDLQYKVNLPILFTNDVVGIDGVLN